MLTRSTAEIVPFLIRRVALSGVHYPRVLSLTAVHFLSSLSCVPPGQVLAISSNSIQFIRGLSISCPANFHVTKWVCDGSEHNTTTDNSVSTANSKMSQAQRLKRAVKEYGATVIVFHTCISLFTLGVSYAAVSSGVDVVGLLGKVGVWQSILESKVATGTSTFVIAYAIHKLFAPARMATTLAATPLIVRYLRRIGFLKQPVSKV